MSLIYCYTPTLPLRVVLLWSKSKANAIEENRILSHLILKESNKEKRFFLRFKTQKSEILSRSEKKELFSGTLSFGQKILIEELPEDGNVLHSVGKHLCLNKEINRILTEPRYNLSVKFDPRLR